MKYVQLLIPEYPTNSSLYVRTFQIRFDKVFSICGPQVFLYTPGKHSFHYEGVEFFTKL